MLYGNRAPARSLNELLGRNKSCVLSFEQLEGTVGNGMRRSTMKNLPIVSVA